MVAAIDELIADGATSLVLDLRDNSGGFLDQGILVADAFLRSGDIVFQRSRGVTQRIASADAAGYDLPMVVLVNANSASASEIVAGALQENGRALVVGEQTFGKGVAQNVLPLSNGGQLIYMSFEWLTPERRSISAHGITPDVEAFDDRYPQVIAAEGRGARPGQLVEIVVDGEVLGSATADDDGEFVLYTLSESRPPSAVQGEDHLDLEHDSALNRAVEVLLEQVVQAVNRGKTAAGQIVTCRRPPGLRGVSFPMTRRPPSRQPLRVPAERMSSLTVSPKRRKLSANMSARLFACCSYAAGSAQVRTGSSRSAGTSGQLSGIATLNKIGRAHV